MSSSVSEMTRRTGRLTSSYYGLIAWLAGVTLAIVSVTMVTVWRRRRRQAYSTLTTDRRSVMQPTDVSTSDVVSVDVTLESSPPPARLRSQVSATVCPDEQDTASSAS